MVAMGDIGMRGPNVCGRTGWQFYVRGYHCCSTGGNMKRLQYQKRGDKKFEEFFHQNTEGDTQPKLVSVYVNTKLPDVIFVKLVR